MRLSYLGVVLPLLWGCSGSHVVSGPDKTEAEKLKEAAPAWCATICSKLRSCDAARNQATDCGCDDGGDCNCTGSSGIDEKCESQCEKVVVGALVSEACASVVSRLQRCYDTQGCAVLQSDPAPCRDLENQADDCDGDDDEPPQVPPPSGEGGSYSGSSGEDPYPVPGYGPTATVVTCAESSSGGQADPPAPGTTELICEVGRADCSDGHEYAMTCLETYSGQRACVCSVDGVARGAFSPGSSCPTPTEMNAGCGWALSEN